VAQIPSPQYRARVPQYFMHVSNGHGFVEDEEGRDLADDQAARGEAIAAARDMMAADVLGGHLDLGSFIEVEDGAHKLLFTITFADAIKLTVRRKKPR
jgi:hypothetical protein